MHGHLPLRLSNPAEAGRHSKKMQHIDLTKTYCTVEAMNPAAEQAFDLAHNSKFRILQASAMKRPRKKSRYSTPSFSYLSRRILGFTLDAEMIFDPLEGLRFGSDDDRCDILLDSTNERGISKLHFRLNFASENPDPRCLILYNMSSNGTLIGDHLLSTGHNKSRMLEPNGSTIVRAGPVVLKFEIPGNRDHAINQIFQVRWERYFAELAASRPRLDALILDSDNQITLPILFLPTTTAIDLPDLTFPR